MQPLALWMPFAVVSMGCAAVIALLGERLVRAGRLPTRFVWAAALVAGPCFAVIVRRSDHTQAATMSAAANSVSVFVQGVSASPGDASNGGTRSLTLGVPLVWTGVLNTLEQPLRRSWAAVSGSLLLLLAFASLQMRRRTAQARVVVVDGIPVRMDERLGPAASPFHGGAVIIPSWLQTLDAPLRRLVLAHEEQHLRAGDPSLLLLGTFIVVLFPWSPAAWWMLRRLRLAVEVDCDIRTLHSCGGVSEGERMRYARLLILTAQRSSDFRRPVAATVLIPAVSSHLARRLQMLRNPDTHMTRSRVLTVVATMLAVTTVAFAMPRPPLAAALNEQPAELVGLYLMVPPDVPSAKMLAPGREFVYLRFAPDGRSRMEQILVDARGERVAPKVDVGPWSVEKWQVQKASNGTDAKLCWQLGPKLLCNAYTRDAKSGDITIYGGKVGSKVELVLQRASGQ